MGIIARFMRWYKETGAYPREEQLWLPIDLPQAVGPRRAQFAFDDWSLFDGARRWLTGSPGTPELAMSSTWRHGMDFNPATGLQTLSGIGSPDVGGNMYGTRSSDHWRHDPISTPSIGVHSCGGSPAMFDTSHSSLSSWSGSPISSTSSFDTWSSSSSSHDPFRQY